jgi:hypothetical protein
MRIGVLTSVETRHRYFANRLRAEFDVVAVVHEHTAYSPCIDAGSNAYALGDFDLDNRARIVDGDEDGTTIVDMGAYEYQSAAIPGDLDHDGDVDLDDLAVFAGCLTGPDATRPSGCSEADFDADGNVDLSDFAAFQRSFEGP